MSSLQANKEMCDGMSTWVHGSGMKMWMLFIAIASAGRTQDDNMTNITCFAHGNVLIRNGGGVPGELSIGRNETEYLGISKDYAIISDHTVFQVDPPSYGAISEDGSRPCDDPLVPKNWAAASLGDASLRWVPSGTLLLGALGQPRPRSDAASAVDAHAERRVICGYSYPTQAKRSWKHGCGSHHAFGQSVVHMTTQSSEAKCATLRKLQVQVPQARKTSGQNFLLDERALGYTTTPNSGDVEKLIVVSDPEGYRKQDRSTRMRKRKGGSHPHVSTRKWQQYMHSIHGNPTFTFTTEIGIYVATQMERYEMAMADEVEYATPPLEETIEMLQQENARVREHIAAAAAADESDEEEGGWIEDEEDGWKYWWRVNEQWAYLCHEEDEYYWEDGTLWSADDYVIHCDDDEHSP